MKFLSACSKSIAAVFAAAFVISGILVLLVFNIQNRLLDPDSYKVALEEQEIYTQLPTLVAKQIATSMTYNPCLEDPDQCEGEGAPESNSGEEDDGPPAYLKNLTQEQWESVLTQVLTPAWTQTQTESALDQLFTFLDSDDGTVSITISLVDLKANLSGQNGVNIVRDLVNAQPPCTEQLLDMLFDIASGDFTPDELLLCAPPESLFDELTPEIETALGAILQEIPDEAMIEQNLFGGDEDRGSQGEGPNPISSIRSIRLLLRFSPLLPFLFLGLLTLFGVRSLKGLLLWWGIPIGIVGLSALALALLGLPIFTWAWNYYIDVRIPHVLNREFVVIGFETLRFIFRSILRTIAIQGGLVAFVGIIMAGAGIVLKPPIEITQPGEA
jgi:hypothetical protein